MGILESYEWKWNEVLYVRGFYDFNKYRMACIIASLVNSDKMELQDVLKHFRNVYNKHTVTKSGHVYTYKDSDIEPLYKKIKGLGTSKKIYEFINELHAEQILKQKGRLTTLHRNYGTYTKHYFMGFDSYDGSCVFPYSHSLEVHYKVHYKGTSEEV